MTSTKTDKQVLGKKGEDIAATYLKENGYTILERNYRYKRSEIDIICSKGLFLIFVEVKTRKNNSFGYPEEQITNKQKTAIQKAAIYFQNNTNVKFSLVRYDIISLMIDFDKIQDVKHLEDAF